MTDNTYKYLTLHGTRAALIVGFAQSTILRADIIQGVGRELLRAVDMAARIEMPLVVSFQGVDDITSALIGKLVLLNKKARTHHVKVTFVDISPDLREVFRRVMGDDGLGLQ